MFKWITSFLFRRHPQPVSPEVRRSPIKKTSPSMAWDYSYWTHEEITLSKIPYAVECLVRANDKERTELGATLASLMRQIRPQDWTGLYAMLRYPSVNRQELNILSQLTPNDAVELLGVATLSSNGRIRQDALEALRQLEHPRSIPYALLRAGDWVGEVRLSAAKTIQSLLDLGYASEFANYHPLIDRLPNIRRVDLSDIERSIHSKLLEPEAYPQLREGLRSQWVDKRLFCYRILFDEPLNRPGLVVLALQDRDPAVRFWIAKHVVHNHLEVSKHEFLSLLQDRSSRVSTMIIRSLNLQQASHYHATLIDLAMANTRPVREASQFVLRQSSPTEIAVICRELLANSPRDKVKAGCVACLGETGNRDDYACIQKYLNHHRNAVRAAAIIASARIGPAESQGRIAHFLDDPSGRVRRAAVASLAATPPRYWQKDAINIFEHGTPRGQLAAFRLLLQLDGWDAIPIILKAVVADSDLIVEYGWRGLSDWNRKYGTVGWLKPSAECLHLISSTWPSAQAASAPSWAVDTWKNTRKWIEQVLDKSS